MTRERQKVLVEDIIAGIVCSGAWDAEQTANPEIATNTAKLEDAIYQYSGAYERASLLNGLHVADALRDVAARPSDYADLIGEKLKEVRT